MRLINKAGTYFKNKVASYSRYKEYKKRMLEEVEKQLRRGKY